MADHALYVLGINAYDHDVSACLLRDGEVVAAIAKERLTRIKNDSGFFQEAVEYCLAAAGIALERLDLVVRNSYLIPVGELERRLAGSHMPYQLTARERMKAHAHPLFENDSPHVANCSHHLAHAYSAFGACPFEEGVVMILDGVGSYRCDVTEPLPAGDAGPPLARESESYYRFRGSELEPLRKIWMGPAKGIINDDFLVLPGLGAIYSRVSTYIFGHWNKCGEVMGLAPYGRPGLEPFCTLEAGTLQARPWPATLRRPFLGGSDASWERASERKEWEDAAWRVQEDTERVVLERARWLRETTGASNLVLAGGVALNCVANGKLVDAGIFPQVWIQPAAGDDGVALGCALYGHLALKRRPRTFVQRHSFFGRTYSAKELDEAVKGPTLRLACSIRRPREVAEAAAALLAQGRSLGWFQGGSEFGPRALGHRSILADPRGARMKDRLNARVKHRQAFRPFAPAVPLERATEYFEGEQESPYMLLVKRVRPEKQEVIPAIVHVDGTARVQTVRREDDPMFHALLEAFGRLTGVPVLLNTSFNIRGEPIVETPQDAVACFLGTQLDALVLQDRLLVKRGTHRMLFPFFRFAVHLRRNLRHEALLERTARRFLEA